jgi:hypothetical protein
MWHPSIRKSWQTSPTSGGRSVGIVRSRTKAKELVLPWPEGTEWNHEKYFLWIVGILSKIGIWFVPNTKETIQFEPTAVAQLPLDIYILDVLGSTEQPADFC